ncbi:hypothetical protein [Desulfonatronum parangueonense]
MRGFANNVYVFRCGCLAGIDDSRATDRRNQIRPNTVWFGLISFFELKHIEKASKLTHIAAKRSDAPIVLDLAPRLGHRY